MTASKFHELLTRAIAEFEHGLGCFEAPEIASNPSNGNIAVMCKACGKVVVLTQSEQRIVGPETPTTKPATTKLPRTNRRFHIP